MQITNNLAHNHHLVSFDMDNSMRYVVCVLPLHWENNMQQQHSYMTLTWI
jgi:hypothetical protein